MVFVVGLRFRPAFGTCVVSWAPRLPPAVSGSGARCGRVCWARVSPVPSPSWLDCRGVCFFFFFCALVYSFLFFFFFRAFWSLSLHPLSFGLGWWLSFFFFFFFFSVSLFPVVRCYWLGVAGFGWVVPLCLCGGPFFFFFFSLPSGGGAWPPVVVLAGGLAAVGCFRAFSPSPLLFFFFLGGGPCLFLPLPSLGWRTHWPAFSVVFRAAVFSCVLCGLVPAPWVGWALYTVGSAPLLAGLGPGSAGWAAAPGGCLWFWVRGLGLFVSLPLCGAGNLLGGPPPLSPGALWPRVWPAVLVCGVVARRLPGCAVAGFGWSFRLGSVVSCCAALCRVASRLAVVRCSVVRCGAVCRGLAWCRGGSVEVSLACVVVRSAGRSVAGWWLGGAVRCGWLAGSVLWGLGRAARAGGSGRSSGNSAE